MSLSTVAKLRELLAVTACDAAGMDAHEEAYEKIDAILFDDEYALYTLLDAAEAHWNRLAHEAQLRASGQHPRCPCGGIAGAFGCSRCCK